MGLKKRSTILRSLQIQALKAKLSLRIERGGMFAQTLRAAQTSRMTLMV